MSNKTKKTNSHSMFVRIMAIALAAIVTVGAFAAYLAYRFNS